jgi:hypothetical protein
VLLNPGPASFQSANVLIGTGPPFGQIFSEPVGQICSEATTPLRVRSVSMQVPAFLTLVERATRSATVVPLCNTASRAARISTPVRATASNAVARRTWWTGSLGALGEALQTRPVRRGSANATAFAVELAFASSGQVSEEHSSSAHFRHDLLVRSFSYRRKCRDFFFFRNQRSAREMTNSPQQHGTQNHGLNSSAQAVRSWNSQNSNALDQNHHNHRAADELGPIS